ncbi:hypothetical protein, partial [Rhizosaccharibacter radicis]|nr:hypothetical protein [Acetobacteraceae bacterium KSS12]
MKDRAILASTPPTITGASGATVQSGSSKALLPDVDVSNPDDGTVSVSLSIDPEEGQLSIGDVPSSVDPTLNNGTFLTMSGSAGEVTTALRAVTVTGADVSASRTGSYSLMAINSTRLAAVHESITAEPAEGDPGYVQTGPHSYAVSNDASARAVISGG